MTHHTRRRLQYFRIQPLLLLLALVNISNGDKSFSAAFSSTSPTSSETIRRKVSPSLSLSFCDQRIRASSTRLPLSSLSSSTNNNNNDYPPTSDDRRNQSLEQGNHPLWSLNLNLDSLAQAGAGSRAQELLRRIHALYDEGYYEVSPDIVSYNSVLKAWKEEDEPQAALELLETMIRNEQDEHTGAGVAAGGDERSNLDAKPIRVDVISFNTVIAAFANQGNYAKALELLRKMQKNPPAKENKDNNNGDDDDDEFENYFYPDPDTITYNIVLNSLAQSDHLGAAAQAENLLREMMMRKERNGMSVVDTTSFNTVLYAWSREGDKKPHHASIDIGSSTGRKSRRATPPKKQRPVSAEMAAQRAEDLLTIMEELSEAGNLNVRPDVYSYTTAIHCWAKRSSTKAGTISTDKAQNLLNRMIDRGLSPNQLTYTALMNALSKAGKPERAEYVLHQMTSNSDYQPDTVAFSAIIDGWAKVSSKEKPEAAARALQILDTMKANKSRGMGPTSTTYTSVLTALSKSGSQGACDQALRLLQDMEEEYSSTVSSPEEEFRESLDLEHQDRWSLRPTNIHYNCVLDAYARSARADKAIRAQKLMTVMEHHIRLDCRPDTISYNSLMMACAHATGNKKTKERSFEIALRTFKILVSKGGETGGIQTEGLLRHKPVYELSPTSSTFSHFFRACRKLLPPSHKRRKSILTKSLTICRKLGMLNFFVVHQVQLACQSEDDWKETAGELSDYLGWKQDFKRYGKSVPREWTCNTQQ